MKKITYVKENGDKKIKEIKEYNKQGNMIYSKNSKGYERWNEYDKQGNCIYFKNSNEGKDYKQWNEYNDKGERRFILKILMEKKNGMNMMKRLI